MTAAPYLDALFSLAGRTALVTGGSSGIGRAIAGALGRAGAEVVLLARNVDQLRSAAAELRAAGATAHWIDADLGDRDALHRGAKETAQRRGEPDILVHAAGVNPRPSLDELTTSDWDRTMAVNLDAAFLLGQRFGPGMADRGWGRGRRGRPNRAARRRLRARPAKAAPWAVAAGQRTFVHSLQPLVSKVSPLFTVTRAGPWGVPLAMMLSISPLESLARAQ